MANPLSSGLFIDVVLSFLLDCPGLEHFISISLPITDVSQLSLYLWLFVFIFFICYSLPAAPQPEAARLGAVSSAASPNASR